MGVVSAFAAVVAWAVFLMSGASAQTQMPLKIIVPFPPGGPVDVLARAIGEGLRERAGRSVIVENRPGGNTAIGAAACKAAEPDGNTICLLTASTITLNPYLYEKLSYAPKTDLEPVTNIVRARQILMVHASVPVNTLEELIDYSKKNPDKLNYASFGIGGDTHLIVEWLKRKSGMKLTHIPYNGTAPAMVAFERGDVQATFLIATAPVVQKVKAGQAKGFVIIGDKRDPNLPSIPTFVEVGLPRLDYATWFGAFAPAKTPQPMLQHLSQQIADVIHSPEFLARYVTSGAYEVIGDTPAEFKAYLEKAHVGGKSLVESSGVKLQQ